MKFRTINHLRIFQVLGLSLLPLLFATPLYAAQPAKNPVPSIAVAPSQEQTQALLQAQLTWQKSLIATAKPGVGCYAATYPNGLTPIPCGKAMAAPQIIAHGQPRPRTVGNGADAALGVNGTLSSVTGSFDAVIGVTSLTPGTDPTNTYTSASDFSLQLNTNRFSNPSSICSGAKMPSSCQGWVQFLYSNTGSVLIEYTVIGWGQSKCPTNYSPYPVALGGTNTCYFNTNGSPVPVQAVSNLANLKLTGTATSGGNDEAIVATSPYQVYMNIFPDNTLGLAAYWNGAEYTIVGDGNGTQTNFNPSGVLLNVRMTVNLDLNSTPPICSASFTGWTGETNNLNLEPNCEQQSNGIIFSETNLAVVINTISPTSGPQAGGTPVTLTGTGFTQNMEAGFGSDYIGIQGDCPTATQCIVYAPRATRPGPVTIIVGGTSQGAPFSTPTANAVFNYVATPPTGTLSPVSGVPAGGTALTVGMTNFDAFPGSKIDFDFNGKTTEIDDATCALNPINGANSYCTLQTPPLPATITPPATVPVSVDYNGEIVAVGSFTYQNPPPLPVMDPDTGYITGNTAITLNLANFTAGAGAVVDFDFNGTLTPASDVACTMNGGDSTCTLKDPPFPGGTLPAAVPVSISYGGKTLAVGDFTYRRPTLSFCQQCAVSGGKCMLVNGKWTCSTGGCIRSSPTGVCQ